MQHKVAELEGVDLDRAVAMAEGRRVVPHPREGRGWWTVYRVPEAAGWDTITPHPDPVDDRDWSPSNKWEHGGPIIDRERIDLEHASNRGEEGWDKAGDCRAYSPTRNGVTRLVGPTTLIAAMRAYVASKFGDTVELP